MPQKKTSSRKKPKSISNRARIIKTAELRKRRANRTADFYFGLARKRGIKTKNLGQVLADLEVDPFTAKSVLKKYFLQFQKTTVLPRHGLEKHERISDAVAEKAAMHAMKTQYFARIKEKLELIGRADTKSREAVKRIETAITASNELLRETGT
jgi:hypothetical protein